MDIHGYINIKEYLMTISSRIICNKNLSFNTDMLNINQLYYFTGIFWKNIFILMEAIS